MSAMTRTLVRAGAVGAVSLGIVAAAAGQPPPAGTPARPTVQAPASPVRPPVPPRAGLRRGQQAAAGPLGFIRTELQGLRLTEEQRAQVAALRSRDLPQAQQLAAQLRDARQKQDRAAIQDVRARTRELRVRVRQELMGLLTPQQRQALKARRARQARQARNRLQARPQAVPPAPAGGWMRFEGWLQAVPGGPGPLPPPRLPRAPRIR